MAQTFNDSVDEHGAACYGPALEIDGPRADNCYNPTSQTLGARPMVSLPVSAVGLGVYSLPEAARLIGVPRRRVARWMRGYSYLREEGRRHSTPVVSGSFRGAGGSVLSFADLIELRFVEAFRRHGVSWSTIRDASSRAAQIVGSDHPFSTKRFMTDGRSILMEITSSKRMPDLVDLVSTQVAFGKIIGPYLYKGLDFSADGAGVLRWWQPSTRRRIVLDPQRSFGAPILAKHGVPTRALANAVRADQSVDEVASQFEVPAESVKIAWEFERRLAA